MTLPPHRRDLPEGIVRDTVEKLRGNALVIALQELGGELILTEERSDRARGYYVEMTFSAKGEAIMRVVKKPS